MRWYPLVFYVLDDLPSFDFVWQQPGAAFGNDLHQAPAVLVDERLENLRHHLPPLLHAAAARGTEAHQGRLVVTLQHLSRAVQGGKSSDGSLALIAN